MHMVTVMFEGLRHFISVKIIRLFLPINLLHILSTVSVEPLLEDCERWHHFEKVFSGGEYQLLLTFLSACSKMRKSTI